MNISVSDFNAIAASQLFSGLSHKQLEDVLNVLNGIVVTKSQKETLFKQGQEINHIGCVLEGEISVSSYDSHGNEMLLGKAKTGYTIGANVAFTSTRKSPYFFECTNDSRIFLFPVNHSSLLPAYFINTYYQRLLNLMANEAVRAQYKIDILSQKSARSRIISYLKNQQNKRASDEFHIPYNRDEMARYLCLNRSVLSHELSMMQNEGLINFKNNYFKLNI